MKNLKQLIAFILVSVCLCSCASANDSVTMYAPDGRTINIHSSEVEAYQNVGWYIAPVTTMYALDGRSVVVYSSEADAYSKVGWYYAPVTALYAQDGRSIVVYSSEVEAYKNVGWYTYKPKIRLPIGEYMKFEFLSGAGGWSTKMTLYSDGRFEGRFYDTNMGDTGRGYPNGSAYICDFYGKFENIERINDYSYSMKLGKIITGAPDGKIWISEGVRYTATGPYGLEGGTDFVFYVPDTPLGNLSEEFLSWWPGRYNENKLEKLSHFGICNINTQEGFFSINYGL